MSTITREQAAKRFAELPLPSTSDEHWRFTDLRGFPQESDADTPADISTASATVSDTVSGSGAAPMLDLDVGDPERETGDVRLELDPFVLRLPERQRDLAGGDLFRVRRVGGKAEHVAVPGTRGVGVPGRDVDEVHPLDLHQDSGA